MHAILSLMSSSDSFESTPVRTAPASGPGELFQILRDGVARTRAELIQITGLARSTIVPRVDLLLESRLIQPAGEASSSGGRPPSRLAFNPAARFVVAIDLGASHAIVALSDLSGFSIASQRREVEISEGPELILGWVVNTVRDLAATAALDLGDLVGVGMGLPGPVEHATGRPINPPNMPGWDRFDVPAFFNAEFGVPVFVDNDVNILALGEHARVWPQSKNLLYVKVSTGIGGGIIIGGELQRGDQGTAGDLGHVQVPYSLDSDRTPGDELQLKDLASGAAVARILSARGIPARNSEDVVRLVQSGNLDAIDTVRQAGRYLGEVLATAVNILNPSVVVIGGRMAGAGEHLLAGVREVVYRRSLPLATQNLTIVQSRLGDEAGPLGAAYLAIREVLSASSVDSMLQELRGD